METDSVMGKIKTTMNPVFNVTYSISNVSSFETVLYEILTVLQFQICLSFVMFDSFIGI